MTDRPWLLPFVALGGFVLGIGILYFVFMLIGFGSMG
jgi:hypothetical protein